MSIRWKVNLLFLLLGIISSIVVSVVNYTNAREKIFEEAMKKAEMMSAFTKSAREYTIDTLRPLARKLAGKECFLPEMMGGFFVARSIADRFGKEHPEHIFRHAAVNPTNPDNLADYQEKNIIYEFASNRELDFKKGIIEKNSKRFFYFAQPVVVKRGCLKCHGKIEDAPKDRVEKYPGSGVYNYHANSVAAAFFNYIPIETALREVKMTALKTAGAGILTVLLLLGLFWIIISNLITKPIIKLTRIADNMSRGKGLNTVVEHSSKDEIGKLYKEFNRMRTSVIKLIKIIQVKKRW